MANLGQFYGSGGTPLRIEADPAQAATGWMTQRRRLRNWLEALPDDRWTSSTRCDTWDVADLARHLVSASQFLGYSLHMAAAGTPSMLLEGMDTRATVEAAAAMLGTLDPSSARTLLAEADLAVEQECPGLAGDGWSAVGEAPPGHLPVHLVISHFLWDSWIHERDLVLEQGGDQVVDVVEAEVAVRYIAGLAWLAAGDGRALDLRLTRPDLRIGVGSVDGTTVVTIGSVPAGALVVEGALVDVADRVSGRTAGPVSGDRRAVEALDAFSTVLTG